MGRSRLPKEKSLNNQDQLVDSILSEVAHFGGKIFLGLPPEHSLVTTNDVLILPTWTVHDLLVLNRNFPCQILIRGESADAVDIGHLVDWILPEIPAQLVQQAQEFLRDEYPAAPAKMRALLLDRDGVINIDHGYVSDPDQVQLVPGITDLIQAAKKQGDLVVVITNQSGIGRGYYSENDLKSVMSKIRQMLKVELPDVVQPIDHWEYSAHHPSSDKAEYRLRRQWRKPRPGMILMAARKLQIDIDQSRFVGDKATDLMAAFLAGVGRGYLLASEPTESKPSQIWQEEWSEFTGWQETLVKLDPTLKRSYSPTFKHVGHLAEVISG